MRAARFVTGGIAVVLGALMLVVFERPGVLLLFLGLALVAR